MTYYKVQEGVVTPLTENEAIELSPNVDWLNTALVYAKDEADALRLAGLYDHGKINYGNKTTTQGDVVVIE